MGSLPVIPSHTCRHHSAQPFPPGAKPGVEDSPEQSQHFHDIAFWLFRNDPRIQEPKAELRNPKLGRLIAEIRSNHRDEHRILRLTDRELRDGNTAGCPLCQRLVEWLVTWGPKEQARSEYFVPMNCSETFAMLLSIELGDEWFGPSKLGPFLKLRLDPKKAWFSALAPSEQRHVMTRSASLETTLSRTRAWLHSSFKEDASCTEHTSNFTPTRILEISSDGGATKLRLIEPKEPLPPYTTLSYCWGVDVQPEQLTGAVLQQYKQGIDAAGLPPTLKDAVTVTLGLGICHVWIDALCIIQDDEQDKDREIDRMGDIFEGSAITILASRSDSVTSGFLEATPMLQANDVPWVFETGADIGIRKPNHETRNSKSIVLMPHGSVLAHYVEPLSLRGWALQERLLSSRTLEFGLIDVTWSSKSRIETSSFRETCKHIIRGERPPVDHRHFWSACWAELVSDFTKLALRLPGDRLPALAGIAQRWANGLDDSYVAGLWRSSLPDALIWYTTNRAPSLGSSDTLPAPSWSWAAVKGESRLMTNLHQRTATYAECVGVSLTHRNPDSVFGAVTAGIVKIRGVLAPVELKMAPELRDYDLVAIDGVDMAPTEKKVWLDRDLPSVPVASFLLPVSGRDDSPNGVRMDVVALLLGQNPEGTFSRLGVVFFYTYNQTDRDRSRAFWGRLIDGPKQVIELV